MPGKIFINYRRDDERAFAARLRDRLVQAFGEAHVFMDVDNLMAGQRFDRELEKALAETDILLAVIGPRWMDLYERRRASGERDHVHEEIAGALKRGITLIPVLIEGAPLPRGDALPEDIRSLVLHHKHDVSHEQFGQNVAALINAIKFARKPKPGPSAATVPWSWIGVGALATLAVGYVGAHQLGMPVPWPSAKGSASLQPSKEQLENAARASLAKGKDAGRKPNDERKQAAEDDAALIDGLVPGSRKAGRDCWREGVQKVCGPAMVAIPPGTFRMGSPDHGEEGPVRDVVVRQAFAAGLTHVTRGEYAAFAKDTGRKTEPGCQSFTTKWEMKPNTSWEKPGFDQDDRHPVTCVHWGDATAYAKWLSEKSGKAYRLLTEAESEYVARATTSHTTPPTNAWFGGEEKDTCANANGADLSLKPLVPDPSGWTFAPCTDGYAHTSPAGSFNPNGFGLHDVLGNVWSWTQDCWNRNYEDSWLDERARATGDCNLRVVRGGSWMLGPKLLRSAHRYRYISGLRYDVVGFRVGRALSP